MFEIITVIEKHYVRTEFFKLFIWNTWSIQISFPHDILLNVLHDGIQGSLKGAANVGPGVKGSDQGKVARVSIGLSISLVTTIAAISSLVIPVVVAVVGVVRGVSAQPCTAKLRSSVKSWITYCSPPAGVSGLAKYWERTRQSEGLQWRKM